MCSQFRLLRPAPTLLGGPADRDGGEADPVTSVKIGDMVVARVKVISIINMLAIILFKLEGVEGIIDNEDYREMVDMQQDKVWKFESSSRGWKMGDKVAHRSDSSV